MPMHTKAIPLLVVAPMVIFGLVTSARASETAFTYKTTYRNVKNDPDRIWTGDALAAGGVGAVTIHEYEMRTTRGDLLVSQIWNEDCSSSTCPTRLVRIGPGTKRTVLVDDMMHQVIPPNDPRFAGLSKTGPVAAFAQHPFLLSADGKTLLNGDFKFELGSVKP
jgi:hypothetical protein